MNLRIFAAAFSAACSKRFSVFRGLGYWHECRVFILKQSAACVFAGSFLLLLAISKHIAVPGLQRYDFLFLAAIAIQGVMIAVRLETWREVAVLSLFHLIGVGLELFKTSPGVGAWSYPEPAFFRLRTVLLYSGFMYASVASYIMQSWRIMRLRLIEFPSLGVAVGLSVAIYANFFTDHYMFDFRWLLAACVLLLCGRARVYFTVTSKERCMPVVLAFLLIGFFIWIAENIATFWGAWAYPNQIHKWSVVHPAKISSWTLLVIISFIIVAALKQVFPSQKTEWLPLRPARARLFSLQPEGSLYVREDSRWAQHKEEPILQQYLW